MTTHRQRADLTFRGNLRRGRHGWVRLTPAYSVKIVQQILDDHQDIATILEPFSGTGTTGLVAGQYGLNCDLHDINPFLIWLAEVKCANYPRQQLDEARAAANQTVEQARLDQRPTDELWLPPISNIDRWWSDNRRAVLARIFHALNTLCPEPSQVRDLLLVAFCRSVIQWSNAAFNHQSMSFKQDDRQPRLFSENEEILQLFLSDVEEILSAADEHITGSVRTFLNDSRHVTGETTYDTVITSPPYCNRMSYIRELRPYMFWLGYLQEAKEAGNLDWQAIGGTWGSATSRLNDWRPDAVHGEISRLEPIINEIAVSSDVLSRYVHRYFVDMSKHFAGLFDTITAGGRLFYVVGNSKFYDTLVPTEQLYVDLMHKAGFEETKIMVIRKRNSKKELFEYLVTARKP